MVHAAAPRAAGLRARARAAAEPARAAARHAAGAGGARLRAAALPGPSVRPPRDRLRGIAAGLGLGRRRLSPRAYSPAGATVVAAGDAPHDELAAIVEARSAAGRPPAMPLPARRRWCRRPAPHGDRLALLHRPGAAQSELRIGHVAEPRSTPDYHALLVLNMILGGQFVSRINMNLREEKGYTYGARTAFDFRRGPGPFMLQASVQTEATVDAVLESLSELQAIRGERPVTTGRARDRTGGADPGLPAQLRDGRADQPVGGANRAVRPARRLLHDVRVEGAGAHRGRGDARGRRTHPSRSPRHGHCGGPREGRALAGPAAARQATELPAE
jgi:hypothetical protein